MYTDLGGPEPKQRGLAGWRQPHHKGRDWDRLIFFLLDLLDWLRAMFGFLVCWLNFILAILYTKDRNFSPDLLRKQMGSFCHSIPSKALLYFILIESFFLCAAR